MAARRQQHRTRQASRCGRCRRRSPRASASRSKVGAKSAAGCALAGGRIEIVDDSGAVLGAGSLGDAPWPGTDALFWADVELAAPASPGLTRLSARFLPDAAAEPHQGAAALFDVAVVARPAHTLKVAVTCAGAPIEEAHIRLGPHRGVTDGDGRAAIRLGWGRYELVVWKAGYDTPSVPLQIDGTCRSSRPRPT